MAEELPTSEPPATIRLIAPVQGAVFNKPTAVFIGTFSDTSIEEVTLEVNGNSFMLKVEDGVFSGMLTLREGQSTAIFRSERADPFALNLRYTTELDSKSTRTPYRSHGMVSKKDCLFCHEGKRWKYSNDADVERLCRKCHEIKELCVTRTRALKDSPRCTACHDPHGADNVDLLNKRGLAFLTP